TRAGISRTHTAATPTATSLATTPTSMLPPVPLSWAGGSLPPSQLPPGLLLTGAVESTLNGIFSISPADGSTAYACARPASLSAGAIIWVTHDGAQHWTQLAPLPVVPPRPLTACWIVPDAVDSAIAVSEVSWKRMQANGEPYYAEGTHFVTFDGGQSWQPLGGPQPFDVTWMATYHGVTMANVDDGPSNSAFWISYDQMRTWQSSSAAADYVEYHDFSINPTTGELLAVGGNADGSGNTQLGTSDDFGLHWTTLSTPLAQSTAMVSPPEGSQPWRICGLTQNTAPTSGNLMCSMDGGKTWTERPRLEISYTIAGQGQAPWIATEFAVGTDSTVYAVLPALPSTANISILDTLYRLSPGSDRWQSLGVSPLDLLPSVEYATAYMPGAGIFWYSGTDEFQLYNP
ncbi:MAG: hypothetical protein ACLQUY_02565, partial [Ktedonobacterales bacterium]